MNNNDEKLRKATNIQNALLADLMEMSDEEILAEMVEDGIDPEALRQKMLGIVDKAWTNALCDESLPAIFQFHGPYRWLSNFTLVKPGITYNGVQYKTVEHAYVAAKFPKDKIPHSFLAECSPGEAKRAGRDILLPTDWETRKVVVMKDFIRQKFVNDTSMMDLLLDTGRRKIIEGNSWGDDFWGVTNNGHGHGKNKLGIIIMEVRKELQEGKYV